MKVTKLAWKNKESLAESCKKIKHINYVNNFRNLSRTKEQILLSDADAYLAVIITSCDYYS